MSTSHLVGSHLTARADSPAGATSPADNRPAASLPATNSPAAAGGPYPRLLNAIPLIGGLADPIMGVFSATSRIFRRFDLPPAADTPRRRRRGITFVLGGIEGPSQHGRDMAMGLLRSGYRGAVAIFPWNRCVPVIGALRNLMNRRHHEAQSDELVRRIRGYRAEQPAAPICLIAQSGGCWVTVRALEKLGSGAGAPSEHEDVACAVLLAPSISPAHDIRIAARRCRGGLFSLGGPGDFFFLGLGTLLLGTSDRVFSPAAGLVGWHHRDEHFHELRWHPSWSRHGYVGNHITTSFPAFVRHVIAPLIGRGGHRADRSPVS